MTNHEYARLLLEQPEMPFYVSIQGETYYSPDPPVVEEGPDPIELKDKLDKMYWEIREIPDRTTARITMEKQELDIRSEMISIKYTVAEI